MHRSVSFVFAAAIAGGMSMLGWGVGCSSSSSPPNPADTGTGGDGGACNPVCDDPTKLTDPMNPPSNCGPCGLNPIDPKPDQINCPGTKGNDPTNPCMYRSAQSGTTLNYRMGVIRVWAPQPLISLAPIAVNPNVNPACFKSGGESFNWLLQVDTAAKTLTTGGAPVAPDHKTFQFLKQTVKGSSLGDLCTGFTAPDIEIAPITLPITFDASGKTFTTSNISLVNIPIFDAATGIPVILPIRQGVMKDVAISDDKNCLGKWEAQYAYDGTTLGWTTAGVIAGFITADDADNVPVKTANCKSLCAILTNDSTKVTPDGKRCLRGTDGKVVPDASHGGKTSDGTAAFLLSATFGAYGVDITGTSSGDSGPGDTGSDTGTADAGDGG